MLSPYVRLTSFTQNASLSFTKLHHHFPISPKFATFKLPTSNPPFSNSFNTLSYFNHATPFPSIPPSTPPTPKRILISPSPYFKSLLLVREKGRKKYKLKLLSTDFTIVNRLPKDIAFAFQVDNFFDIFSTTTFQLSIRFIFAPTGRPR